MGNEKARLAHYTVDYFTSRNCAEINAWRRRMLRPDQVAGLAYAFGFEDYAEVCRVMGWPEKTGGWIPERRDIWRNQVAAILEHGARRPALVIDIGGGRGEVGVSFKSAGVEYVNIDPAPGVPRLILHTMREWTDGQVARLDLIRVGMLQGLRFIQDRGDRPDTIIMCESIEHIPAAEFDRAWPMVVELLAATSGLFIVTNWIDRWPIPRDATGWDHVRRIDDDLFDALAGDAARVVFRRGAHLVLEF